MKHALKELTNARMKKGPSLSLSLKKKQKQKETGEKI
jgi:hypothetical protein